jgi:hypothetical protein
MSQVRSLAAEPMELKEFIKKCLIDIHEGVKEGNNDLVGKYPGDRPFSLGNMKSEIQFDMAVSSEDSVSGKIGGGIKVIAVNLGSIIDGSTKSASVSRIKFSVYTNFNLIG